MAVARDSGCAEYTVVPAFNLLTAPAGVEPVPATAIIDAIAHAPAREPPRASRQATSAA